MLGSRGRLLIVSHTFAPDSSSRAIRLAHLARHFRRLGWEVAAYTTRRPGVQADFEANPGVAVLLEGVEIVRSSPGPVFALAKTAMAPRGAPVAGATSRARSFNSPVRSWMTRRLLEPSLEWTVTGLPGLLALMERFRPTVVLSSSHPYCSQLLCRVAASVRQDFRWVGDFGDPLIGGGGVEPEPVWRELWSRVEEGILRRMDHLAVTTKRTRALVLRQYPSLLPEKVSVIRNGFDPGQFAFEEPRGGPLTLTYTGSLYYPRVGVDPFVEALLALRARDPGAWAGCRVRVVGPVVRDVGERLRDLSNVELVGEVPFEASLREIKRANVLLLWGNRSGVQIPAKVYHYIGSGRPILCIVDSLEDDLADLLAPYAAARVVLNTAEAIGAALEELWTGVASAPGARGGGEFIASCAWDAQIARFERLFEVGP